MNTERWDDLLRNKLDEQRSPVDADRIWNQIKHEIPHSPQKEEKKRRIFPWLWAAAIMGGVAIGTAWWLMHYAPTSPVFTQSTKKASNTDKLNTSNSENQNNTELTQNTNIHSSIDQNTLIQKNKIQNTHQSNQINSEKQNLDNNYVIQNPNNSTENIGSHSSNLEQETILSHSQISNNTPANQRNSDIINALPQFANVLSISSISGKIHPLEIPAAVFTEIPIPPIQQSKLKNFPLTISAHIGGGIAQMHFTPKSGNSDSYAQLLNTYLKPLESAQAQFGIHTELNKHWTLGLETGIQYVSNQLNYTDSKSSTINDPNAIQSQYVNSQGDTVTYYNGLVNLITTTKGNYYNDQFLGNLGLMAGYTQSWGKHQLHLSAGPAITLYQKYQGKFLDPDGHFIDEKSSITPQSYLSTSAFHLNGRAEYCYAFKPNIAWTAGVQTSWWPESLTNNDAPISESLTIPSVQLGMKWKL